MKRFWIFWGLLLVIILAYTFLREEAEGWAFYKTPNRFVATTTVATTTEVLTNVTTTETHNPDMK